MIGTGLSDLSASAMDPITRPSDAATPSASFAGCVYLSDAQATDAGGHACRVRRLWGQRLQYSSGATV